jgi:hypothetical protein
MVAREALVHHGHALDLGRDTGNRYPPAAARLGLAGARPEAAAARVVLAARDSVG